MRGQPVPDAARGRAFATRDAADVGLSPKRLRRPEVAHPFHGVNGVGLDLASVVERCRAFDTVMLEGQFFSHTTALALAGAPLPADGDRRIHVSVRHPRTPPRRRGVHGHSMRRFDVTLLHGLACADVASAWCQSASLLSREDLVAAGDFLITGPRVAGVRGAPPLTVEALEGAARRHRDCAGSTAIRWALPRLRSGVDSRPETLLRLLLVGSGQLEPTVDHPVDVGGGLVLHGDLAYPAHHVILEYEGDGHRTSRAQWLRDIERRELFEAAGERVVRMTSIDLFERPESFLLRLRDVLALRRAQAPANGDGGAVSHDDPAAAARAGLR